MTAASNDGAATRPALTVPVFVRGCPPAAGQRGFQPYPRRRRLTGQHGFTLLEIAIVIFIMGLMLTIAVPYIGGWGRAELKSAARRLAGRATYLFSEASTRKLVIRLVFDLDRNSYRVLIADPYAPQPRFFPDQSWAGAPVTLPSNVRIHDVTVEGVGTFTRGAVACQFYPEGYVDATLLHLVDNRGNVMTLRFDPLTGRVLIAQGRLTQTEMAAR